MASINTDRYGGQSYDDSPDKKLSKKDEEVTQKHYEKEATFFASTDHTAQAQPEPIVIGEMA